MQTGYNSLFMSPVCCKKDQSKALLFEHQVHTVESKAGCKMVRSDFGQLEFNQPKSEDFLAKKILKCP